MRQLLEFLNFLVVLVWFLVYLIITGVAILMLSHFLTIFFIFYLSHYQACKFLSAQGPISKELVEIAKKENIFLEVDSKLEGAYFQQFGDGRERIILSVKGTKEIEKSRRVFSVFQKDILLIALEENFAHELGHHFYYANKPENFSCSFGDSASCVYRELEADEIGIKILIPIWGKYYKTMGKKAATGQILLNRLEVIIDYLDNPEFSQCKEMVEKNACPKSEEVLRKLAFFKKVLEEGRAAFKK